MTTSLIVRSPFLSLPANQLGVELDRKSLANLAIWEPRSFEALVEIAKKYEVQSFENKLK